MHFYGISFIHPYKQSGRRLDVLDIKTLYQAHPTIDHTSSTSCHQQDCLYGCM